MGQISFNPSSFTTQKAKPLPVILLLDISGSMRTVTNPDEVRSTGRTGVVDGQTVEFVEGGITRISILNKCVRKMLDALSTFERDATEFLISIITFGNDTRMALEPTPACDARFTDLQADGQTPLGRALDIAKTLIEDRSKIPSRSYRPLVVLVSDGEPNDDWEGRLADFIHNGRTAKCDRMALAIGPEADHAMLARFVEGTDHEVSEADTADQIYKFFKYVTLSTVQRTKSQDPNATPPDGEIKRLVQASTTQQKNNDDDDDDDDPWY